MRLARFGSIPVPEQEPEHDPAEDGLVEEGRGDRVDDLGRVERASAGTARGGTGRGRCRRRSPRRWTRRRGPGSRSRDGRPGPGRGPPPGPGGSRARAGSRRCPAVYQASRRSSEGGRPQRSMSSYSAALKRSASKRRMTSSSGSPTTIRTRSGSGTSSSRPTTSGIGRSGIGERASAGARWASFLAHAQDRQEGLLRDLDGSDALHPLLSFLLLLEELALAGDVATVALREDVLAHRGDGLAGDDVAADRGLDRHLEHLARDELA